MPMTVKERINQIERLKKEIKGWEIFDVEYVREDEILFVLTFRKDKQKKRIKLFATDLGWWFQKKEKKRKKKIGKNGYETKET